MTLVVYDCEIANAIPERGAQRVPDIEYCEGWHDYAGMGVAVIVAYVEGEGYRVFLRDNFEDWRDLVARRDTVFAGFNNRVFDDRLVAAALGTPIPESRSYDLLREFRVARGTPATAVGGCNLHDLCRANYLVGKRGTSAFAPMLWQMGKRGQVIDHCLSDCEQTKQLIELVLCDRLSDPETGARLTLAKPPMGYAEEARRA